MKRIYRLFFLALVLSSCQSNKKPASDNCSPDNVETIALNYLVKKLFGNLEIYNYGEKNLDLDTTLNSSILKLTSKNNFYYSDSTTCNLTALGILNSSIGLAEYHNVNPSNRALLEGDFQKKSKEGYLNVHLNLCRPIEIITWTDFKKIRNKDAIYLNVCHHLGFNDIFLVEIDCAVKSEVESSILHKFYFFIKNNSVESWDYIQMEYINDLNFCETTAAR